MLMDFTITSDDRDRLLKHVRRHSEPWVALLGSRPNPNEIETGNLFVQCETYCAEELFKIAIDHCETAAISILLGLRKPR
jgi:hypothetical protein